MMTFLLLYVLLLRLLPFPISLAQNTKHWNIHLGKTQLQLGADSWAEALMITLELM